MKIYKDDRGVIMPAAALRVVEKRNNKGRVVSKLYQCAYCGASVYLGQDPDSFTTAASRFPRTGRESSRSRRVAAGLSRVLGVARGFIAAIHSFACDNPAILRTSPV